jgi:hypothetical protein
MTVVGNVVARFLLAAGTNGLGLKAEQPAPAHVKQNREMMPRSSIPSCSYNELFLYKVYARG